MGDPVLIVACHKCKKPPTVARHGSYWRVFCPTFHTLRVDGHVMKTKREAIEEWNRARRSDLEDE